MIEPIKTDTDKAIENRRARVIAFYLPQFHPIPENDEWWGNGFTEWTNVAKAKPLFRGHYQPHIPADLGFYDLRVPEVRELQARLAREHGIEGFAYWHYWFGNGRRLLERPFNEVLQSGSPDFPFCLAWANQTWSGIWHGSPEKILIEQKYPGNKDHEKHFYEIQSAFHDKRYIKVNNKPVFIIYAPLDLPNSHEFIELWNNLAIKEGLEGIYFIGVHTIDWDHKLFGFDAKTHHAPGLFRINYPFTLGKRIQNKILKKIKIKNSQPLLYDYKTAIEYNAFTKYSKHDFIPCLMPNWDNTPRSGSRGIVFINATAELFAKHLNYALEYIKLKPREERIIFIKSWNEWAEGNYLEPDSKWGKKYLEVIKATMS